MFILAILLYCAHSGFMRPSISVIVGALLLCSAAACTLDRSGLRPADGGIAVPADASPDVGLETTDTGVSADAARVDAAAAVDSGSPADAGDSTDGGDSPGIPVNLGTAGAFVILASSAITSAPTAVIAGNVGISPGVAAAITGLALVADSSNTFSTSTQVSGRVYAANYMPPTPADLTIAVGDMMTAFTNAAARPPDFTELGGGNVDGMTLVPGVYRWTTALPITTDVTLSGNATDVWIFQIAQTLALSAGVRIQLAGGALPKNVFWQVVGAVTLGAGAHCEGVILAQASVDLGAGASITGRLLAQTAVTIAMSTVVEPAP